jgi:hypothetical protein
MNNECFHIHLLKGGRSMEQENFSELFNKVSKMMENGEIPENIKNMLNNNFSNSEQNSYTSSENPNFEDTEDGSSSNNSFNFDFETFLKLQQIMNSLKSEKNDPRTNLLLSLKPYLKDSRKQKIEQYINIFKMTKIIDLLNKSGGENIK